MLNIKTLNIKKYFTKRDKTKVLDLTQASLVYKFQVSYERVIFITEEFVMRPDLISETVYGNGNMLDYILKYNEISNPFSIFEGQYLFIPNRDEMDSQFVTDSNDETDTDDAIKTEPSDNRYPSDDNRSGYLDKIKDGRLNRNIPVETTAPNTVDDGQSNIVFKKNKIIFGGNVTDQTIDDCPELSTKARVKEALLSNRSNLIASSTKITSITNVNQNNQTT